MSYQNGAAHSISKALALIGLWAACLAIIAITLPYVAKGDGEAISLLVFMPCLAATITSAVIINVW